MHVVEAWRFPVKSLQGERLDSVAVTAYGIRGDRQYAIFDTATGLGLTARRDAQLLFAAASLDDDGLHVTTADGTLLQDDAALSAWLGRPVVMRSADQQVLRRYEGPIDFEHEASWETYDGASAHFHDAGEAAVTLVSTASLGDWDPRRFRANLVVSGRDEDALVGRRVAVGGAQLDVGMRVGRCVMTTRPQPGGIERDLDVLRTIHRERGGNLSVGAVVAQPGPVHVGDEVSVTGAAAGASP